jgi:hypothetical protein
MPGINVNQITSMLAKLADPALQQYAAMHKDNPYIVSLAVAESTRRKELRAAGAGQGAMQPQPKVADAAIAEMGLPEQQGIGALPAPNMQGMADGGIAGYDDREAVELMAGGGMVERYQFGGSIFNQLDQQKAGQIAQLNEKLTILEPQLRAAAASGDQQAIQMYAQEVQAIRNQINAVRESAGNRVDAIDKLSAPAASPAPLENMSGMDRRMQAGSMPNVPSVSTSAKVTPPKERGAPSAGAAPGAGLFSLANLRKQQEEAMAPLNYEAGALRNQAVDLGAELERGAAERLAKRKEEIEKEGDIYAGRAERIKTREAGLAKEKDANTNMALLETFLTIAGTRGSLGEAVGAGGRAGLRAYGAGLDKLRAAQEKLEDAKDRTEELRLNRSDMNKREIRELERDRDNALLKGKELMYGVSKDLYGFNRQDTNALLNRLFEGQKAQFEAGSRERIAQMQLSAQRLPGEAQMAMMLGTGTTDAERLRSGLAELAKFKAKDGGMNIELLKQFVEAKKTDPSMTPDAFLTQAAQVMLPTTSKPPANSVVRTQPGQ